MMIRQTRMRRRIASSHLQLFDHRRKKIRRRSALPHLQLDNDDEDPNEEE